ncbi:MAG: hypothetical protein MJH11_15985, partial [Lentisphaeria bacterium]|nr:hypothetical protein [Lentisphaeria bacterium]
MTAEDYLNSIKRESVDIDRFLSKAYHADRVENNDGWTYSSELGWVLKDAWRLDGIAQGALEKSKTFYSYEAGGARKIINFREKESRIHSYGNSFTHCDQVSDGETWQENLAANFQEPIENYGVGGYGVYQAYKRMRIVEETHPAEFIILNIWSDDHFRNLDSWRSIRFGCFTSCGLTKPFLRVNVEKQECIEHENLCPTEDALYNLSDMDFLLEKFADDPVLAATLITKQNQKN